MIAIFDYGSGNLRSAQRAFESTGEEVVTTSDVKKARGAKGLVIPGVGAFAACMSQLVSAGGFELLQDRAQSGDAIIGICVGMQILFEKSSEKGTHTGVGILKGDVSKLNAAILPQIGWNTVKTSMNSRLFKGVENESFYFVHSFAARANETDSLNTTANYGEDFLAAIERGNVSATQFHPEKSGRAGLALIKNWVNSIK